MPDLISRISEGKGADLTEREIDVMKHALGWPKNYRNHFCAGEEDAPVWDGLVAKGVAFERPNRLSPDRLFHVTEAGLRALEPCQ